MNPLFRPLISAHGLAVRVAVWYGVFGVAWIILTDGLIARATPDLAAFRQYQALKGLVFIAASALLIFVVLRRGLDELSRAQAALRASEDRLRLLVDSLRDYALYMLDPAGRIVSWNPGAERIKGYTAAEALGASFDIFFSAEDRAAGLPAHILEAAQREEGYSGDGWLVRKDGTAFWVECTATALRAADGTLRGFVILSRDLTVSKLAVDALRATEARLARAQSHARIGHWTRDIATGQLTMSDSLHEIVGVPRERWAGTFDAFFERVHSADRARVGRAIQQAFEGPGSYDVEFRIVRPDGEERVLDTMGEVEFDAARRPVRASGTALDVTERVRAQQALEHSRAQLAGVVGSAMDAVITVDAEQRIVLFNTAAEEMFGVRQSDAIGTPIERFIPPDVRGWHRRKVEEFGAMGVTTRSMGRLGMVRGLRAGGEEFPAEASISQVKLGHERYFTVILRDVTERVRAEARVHEYATRLQRLSIRLMQVQERERRHLARELHDEIGQTLTAAKLRVQQLGEEPPVRETVTALDRVLQQVRTLSLNLRPSMLDDLGLPATLRWYLNQQGELGNLEIALETTGLEARLDPEIETAAFRIVQETLTNVLRHAAAKRVEVEVLCDGRDLVLRVSDDGLGFDPKARSASFGLQGMRERAMLAGGALDIESAPGRGTVVTARLPARTNPDQGGTNDE